MSANRKQGGVTGYTVIHAISFIGCLIIALAVIERYLIIGIALIILSLVEAVHAILVWKRGVKAIPPQKPDGIGLPTWRPWKW